jgi:hypothetical protein
MPRRHRQPDRIPRTREPGEADVETSGPAEPQPRRRLPRRQGPPQAARRDPRVTGVVGDRSDANTERSGDDTRRRGWFWHWNSIVTQYAPLIGLKGFGLLNSYTVWTDRREESPTRGYAFPSQQREAAFYGEDRAELITINKILVALDLIEIRKEMVLRADEKGRRWRVPHNFYRVKDQGDGFTLSADAVDRVVELADNDAAVYRYVRRIFSEKFAPIDGANVWHAILEELRPTERWQRLAAKTAKTEKRASARSKAGHASRRAQTTEEVFSLPDDGDTATPETTAAATGFDSGDMANDSRNDSAETTVAESNTGSGVDVAPANNGSSLKRPTGDGKSNRGRPTSVRPSNRTYHQESTTTTEIQDDRSTEVGALPETPPPVELPMRNRAIRQFEEANDRAATTAEQRLLAALVRDLEKRTGLDEVEAWRWIGDAVDEAVAAGSAYVAPRRVGEIVIRWSRDGRGDSRVDNPKSAQSQGFPRPVTREGGASHRLAQGVVTGGDGAGQRSGRRTVPPPPRRGDPVRVPSFEVPVCGLSNHQVWSAVVDEVERGGSMPRVDVDAWLRVSGIVGVRGEALVVGVPNVLAERRAAGRYLSTLAEAVERVTGVRFPLAVVVGDGSEAEDAG